MLKTLGTNKPSSSVPPPVCSTTAGPENSTEAIAEASKQPAKLAKDNSDPTNRRTTEELRRRLLEEQEKTRQISLLTGQRLPPINMGQRSAPRGFSKTILSDIQLKGASTTGAMHTARTLGFQMAPQPEVNALWEDYCKNYEREMRTSFLKSVTKGPRMEFPKFDGENPRGGLDNVRSIFKWLEHQVIIRFHWLNYMSLGKTMFG